MTDLIRREDALAALTLGDTMTALQRKIASIPPAPNAVAVKVKKLEWENSALFFKCDWLTVRLAETPVGQYAVKQSDSGYFRVSVNAQFLYGNHPDIKSAKDAAQADYDTRILSAIETTPDPRDAVIARLVEMLARYEFECDGGNLRNCQEYVELRRLVVK